jgi:hypothetical protein
MSRSMMSLKEPGLTTYPCSKVRIRLERTKESKTYQIESDHIGFPDPFLHIIGNLLRSANRRGAETTDGDVFANGLFGPFGYFGCCLGPAFDSRSKYSQQSRNYIQRLHRHIPDGIALDMSQLLIIPILVQINTSPATEEGQSPVNRSETAIVLELLKSLFLSTTQDRTQQCQELDTLRITSKLTLGELANLSDVLGYNGRAVACNEDGLGMLCRKGLSGLGCSRL